MNNYDKPVLINGTPGRVNLLDGYNLTSKKDVELYNKMKLKNHKKHVVMRFGMMEKGIGDIIEYFTTKLGIKWLILKLFKECGCEKRRIYFNKWHIYLPFFEYKNRLKFVPTEVVEEPVIALGNTNEKQTEDQPIPRSMLSKNRKPCGCGKDRL